MSLVKLALIHSSSWLVLASMVALETCYLILRSSVQTSFRPCWDTDHLVHPLFFAAVVPAGTLTGDSSYLYAPSFTPKVSAETLKKTVVTYRDHWCYSAVQFFFTPAVSGRDIED